MLIDGPITGEYSEGGLQFRRLWIDCLLLDPQENVITAGFIL